MFPGQQAQQEFGRISRSRIMSSHQQYYPAILLIYGTKNEALVLSFWDIFSVTCHQTRNINT